MEPRMYPAETFWGDGHTRSTKGQTSSFKRTTTGPIVLESNWARLATHLILISSTISALFPARTLSGDWAHVGVPAILLRRKPRLTFYHTTSRTWGIGFSRGLN